MCRVNVTTTLEEQSIHVEESGNPASLVYAIEGEEPAPVARLAWRAYIRTHPANSVHLQFQRGLPSWRLVEAAQAAIWLLRRIINGGQR